MQADFANRFVIEFDCPFVTSVVTNGIAYVRFPSKGGVASGRYFAGTEFWDTFRALYHVDALYAALVHGAENAHPTNPAVGRLGVRDYL